MLVEHDLVAEEESTEVEEGDGRWALVFVCLAVFFAPIENSVVAYQVGATPDVLFTACALAVIGPRIARSRVGLRGLNQVGLLYALFWLWVFASAMWSPYGNIYAATTLLTKLPLALLFVLVRQVSSTAKNARSVALAYVASSWVMVLQTLQAWLTNDAYTTNQYTAGGAGTTYTAFVIATGFLLYLRVRKGRGWVSPVLILVPSSTAFFLTGSRGAVVALVAMLAFAAVLMFLRGGAPWAVPMAPALLLVKPLIDLLPPETVSRVSSSADLKAHTAQLRVQLWVHALDEWRRTPFIGNGFNAIPWIEFKAVGSAYAAHNDYVRILAEFGLIGLLLFVAAFIRLFIVLKNPLSRMSVVFMLVTISSVDLMLGKALWILIVVLVSVEAFEPVSPLAARSNHNRKRGNRAQYV